MKNKLHLAHVAAIFTIFIWATTFISTKVLLVDFQPIEILFLRFVLGILILCIIHPHRLRVRNRSQEKYFIVAGLCGVCLYYLLENIALTYSSAANIGVIIAIAPFFTSILNCIVERNRQSIHARFIIGFIISMLGIAMISFQDGAIQFHPIGDGLAMLAAFVWGIYSLLVKKISTFHYPTIAITRRLFMYGILFMIPCLSFFDVNLQISLILKPLNFGNLLFLGIGASAVCFVTWHYALKELGPIRTNVYIYLVPVITMFAAAIFLREKITLIMIAGALLTVVGLFISEKRRGHNG